MADAVEQLGEVEQLLLGAGPAGEPLAEQAANLADWTVVLTAEAPEPDGSVPKPGF